MVKKIQFKQHEMVKFISETIMELRAQRIKEQNRTPRIFLPHGKS